MIDYLKQFNITNDDIKTLKTHLTKEVVKNLEIAQVNVIEVLNFLKEFGVNNLLNVIKYRPDICLKEKRDLERDLTLFDKDLLIFIFNNSIDDLINFKI
ncbi:MAG: hypothetical protein PHF21_01110 [Bacilli bacterium]|nr:hypothetical protein [Bacilli bacterium]